VPIAISLDSEPFDERTETVDTFYERMRNGAVATTSQPSPLAFFDAYERAAARGAASILSLHLDRRVSGVTASAMLAAREAPSRVVVVDLPTVSYGVGLCVRAAHDALAGGASVSEARALAERVGSALDNAFVARSAPGGRVSASDDWAVLRFADGKSEPMSSHTSIAEATDAVARRVIASGRPGSVAVGHAGRDVEAAADRLAHDLLRAQVETVERYRVGPSVGAHTGPDSFGVFWQPAGR
jgi:DegV family protein with EDD domain